ncbi:MAG: phosphotransferase [Saprospiraceae bacterium]
MVRIGELVHRSSGSNAPFAHALLQHLEQVQFPNTPRFRGIDSQGRTKLTFLPGAVPDGDHLEDTQIIACVQLLRGFHDAAALSPLCGDQETICHHDFAPWNVIFQGDQLVGVIDFDEAKPGERIIDLAYFLWTFLNLGTSDKPADILIEKIVLLCEVYGLKDGRNLVPAILKEQARILSFRKEHALNASTADERIFSAGAVKSIQQEIVWVKTHQMAIDLALQTKGI